MKTEEIAAVLPAVFKHPKLAVASSTLVLVGFTISKISQFISMPIFALSLIGLLTILAMLFAYRSFEKCLMVHH